MRHTHPKWVRDAIAECRRVGAAPFLKQWGNYRNNPLVVEQGLLPEDAKRLDVPGNGKGGGMLDGRLWREFPVGTPVASATGRRAKDGVERRAVSAW
jgi:protein gp37